MMALIDMPKRQANESNMSLCWKCHTSDSSIVHCHHYRPPPPPPPPPPHHHHHHHHHWFIIAYHHCLSSLFSLPLPRLPNTLGLEVWLDPKKRTQKIKPQQVFGRLGISSSTIPWGRFGFDNLPLSRVWGIQNCVEAEHEAEDLDDLFRICEVLDDPHFVGD